MRRDSPRRGPNPRTRRHPPACPDHRRSRRQSIGPRPHRQRRRTGLGRRDAPLSDCRCARSRRGPRQDLERVARWFCPSRQSRRRHLQSQCAKARHQGQGAQDRLAIARHSNHWRAATLGGLSVEGKFTWSSVLEIHQMRALVFESDKIKPNGA